jgi:biotin-requiring enzyme
VQWEKQPGEFVDVDDVVAVVETDKVPKIREIDH